MFHLILMKVSVYTNYDYLSSMALVRAWLGETGSNKNIYLMSLTSNHDNIDFIHLDLPVLSVNRKWLSY